MKRAHIETTLGLLSLTLLLTGCVTAPHVTFPLERSEAEIAESDVPPAALAALRELSGGQPLTECEREDRGDYIAYEAEWDARGVEVEATVLADGSLLETEHELTSAELAKLPAGVRARVAELQKQGYEVEVSRRTFVLYELDAERTNDDDDDNDGDEDDEVQLLVRPDGKNAK